MTGQSAGWGDNIPHYRRATSILMSFDAGFPRERPLLAESCLQAMPNAGAACGADGLAFDAACYSRA